MILANQPSIEDKKHARDLIAHIEPADDEVLSEFEPLLIDEDTPAEQDAADEATGNA